MRLRKIFLLMFLLFLIIFLTNVFPVNAQPVLQNIPQTSKSIYLLGEMAKNDEVKKCAEEFLQDWEKLKVLESEGGKEDEINKLKEKLLSEIAELKVLAKNYGESKEFMDLLILAENKLNVSVSKVLILKPEILVSKKVILPGAITLQRPFILTINDKKINKDLVTYMLWRKTAVSPEDAFEILQEIYVLSEKAKAEGIDDKSLVVAEKIREKEDHFVVDYVLGRLYTPEDYANFKSNKNKFLRDTLNKVTAEKKITFTQIDYVKLLGKKKDLDWSKVVVAEVDGVPFYLREVLDLYPSHAIEIFLGSTDKPEIILKAIQVKYLKKLFETLSKEDQDFVNDMHDFIKESTISEIFYLSVLSQRVPTYKIQINENELRNYYTINKDLFKIQGKVLPFDTVKGEIEKKVISSKTQNLLLNLYKGEKKALKVQVDAEVLKTITDEEIKNFWKERG